MTWRDQGLTFVIGGFPLLLGPVLRGLTVAIEAVNIDAFACFIPKGFEQAHAALG